MEAPIPYKGNNGYIFVSYAHRDSAQVWPIVARLQADGYRVWYDEGIDPGTEWDENIAAHVENCGYFVAVLSSNYFASDNCKDELNYSRDLGKPQLLIYLEDVELPRGMAMRMGRNQTAHFHHHENPDDFFQDIYSAPDFSCFQGNNLPPVYQEVQRHRTRMGGNNGWMIGLLLLLGIAAAVFGYFLNRQNIPEETAPLPETTTQAPVETTAAQQTFASTVVADTDAITLTVLNFSCTDQFAILDMALNNKHPDELTMRPQDLTINGFVLDDHHLFSFKPNETTLFQMAWPAEQLAAVGMRPSDIASIVAKLRFESDTDSRVVEEVEFSFYPRGEDQVPPVSYTPKSDDLMILDTEEYLAALTHSSYNPMYKTWSVYLIFHNKTAQQTKLLIDHTAVNGTYFGNYTGVTSDANTIIATELFFLEEDWRTEDQDQVLFFGGALKIKQESSDTGIAVSFVYYPEGEEAAAAATYTRIVGENIFSREDVEELCFSNQITYSTKDYLCQHKISAAYLDTVRSGTFAYDRFILLNKTDEPLDAAVLLSIQDQDPVLRAFTLQPGQPVVWTALRRNPYTPCTDKDIVMIGTADPSLFSTFPQGTRDGFHAINFQTFVPIVLETDSEIYKPYVSETP